MTEEEKLPSHLWRQLNENPEDQKLWLQISSKGKRKIVKCIPSDEPQGNLQVMKHVFQLLLHQRHSEENRVEDQAEESTDSDDTREHNYYINQARSRNKGDSKLEKASEVSPGYPTRVMSSREGRDRVQAHEAKSRNASEKLYKTQSNWSLSAARFKGSNKKRSKGLRVTLKKYIPQKLQKLFSSKSTSTNNVVYNIMNGKAWRQFKLLCNGGANGSIVDPNTCRIFWKDPIKKVDITGIDDHQVCNIQLCSAGFVTETQLGPTIIIIHNAAAVQ